MTEPKDDKPRVQLYCPAGNVTVDYTDQSVYSKAESWIAGSEWLHSKHKLPQIAEEWMPPSHEINDRAWVGNKPEEEEGRFYFLKDGMRNWATGIYVIRTLQECLQFAEAKKRYVVQPNVQLPLLHEGRKCHIRLYFVLVSPVDSTGYDLHWCKIAYLCRAHGDYDEADLDKSIHISRDRHCLANEWEHWPEIEPKCLELLVKVVGRAYHKLESVKNKTSFDFFGADIIVTQDMEVLLLEINRSPLVRDSELPLLQGVLNLVVGPENEDDVCHLIEFGKLEVEPDDATLEAVTSQGSTEENQTEKKVEAA